MCPPKITIYGCNHKFLFPCPCASIGICKTVKQGTIEQLHEHCSFCEAREVADRRVARSHSRTGNHILHESNDDIATGDLSPQKNPIYTLPQRTKHNLSDDEEGAQHGSAPLITAPSITCIETETSRNSKQSTSTANVICSPQVECHCCPLQISSDVPTLDCEFTKKNEQSLTDLELLLSCPGQKVDCDTAPVAKSGNDAPTAEPPAVDIKTSTPKPSRENSGRRVLAEPHHHEDLQEHQKKHSEVASGIKSSLEFLGAGRCVSNTATTQNPVTTTKALHGFSTRSWNASLKAQQTDKTLQLFSLPSLNPHKRPAASFLTKLNTMLPPRWRRQVGTRLRRQRYPVTAKIIDLLARHRSAKTEVYGERD